MLGSLSQFIELWPLFRDPLVTGVVAWGALGLAGSYIIARQYVFLTAAISQVAGFGVALSMWLGALLSFEGLALNPTLWSVGLSVAALAFFWGQRQHSVSLNATQDAVQGDQQLGLIYIAGLSGTVLIGAHIPHELGDVQALLFGSSVAVSPEGMRRVLWVSALFIGINAWLYRGLIAVTLDPIGARLRGLPVATLDLGLMFGLACLISICTQTLGALPVFAASVLPALTARGLAQTPRTVMIISVFIGGVSAFIGYLFAFISDHPVGPSQALIATIIWGAGRAHQRLRDR